jgi:hypothetical protein
LTFCSTVHRNARRSAAASFGSRSPHHPPQAHVREGIVDLDKASAIAVIAGSTLFLAAAFSPISRIFGMRDASERLEVIGAAPNQWLVAQLLFALGAIVTVIGVGSLAVRLRGHSFSVYLTSSALFMAVGAILWSWHVYVRAVDPALFTAGGIPPWLFAGYSLLTMVGLAFLGTGLLQMALPSWVGWLAIGSAALFFVLAIAFRDMPPFVYYVITLTIGVALYRAAAAGSDVPFGIG